MITVERAINVEKQLQNVEFVVQLTSINNKQGKKRII